MNLTVNKIDKILSNESFCGVHSIDDQLRDGYFHTLLRSAYLYKVCINGITVAYYMINFKSYSLDTFSEIEDISDYFIGEQKSVLALHIQYIAVHKNFQKNGIGKALLRHIISTAKNHSLNCPFRIITLDAFTHLESWYASFGFVPVGRKPESSSTIMMMLDLISPAEFNNFKSLIE